MMGNNKINYYMKTERKQRFSYNSYTASVILERESMKHFCNFSLKLQFKWRKKENINFGKTGNFTEIVGINGYNYVVRCELSVINHYTNIKLTK